MTKQDFNANMIKRSVLYVPGANDRALSKISSLNADCFMLDLEDGVAPKAKATARTRICDFLGESPNNNSRYIVRINHLDSPWGIDDLKAVIGAGAKTVLLPKVNSEKEIEKCNSLLGSNSVKLWAMIETPSGVLNAKEIARSAENLECMVVGTSDLVNDLRAEHTPDRLPVLYSLCHTILAARASGLDVIDGVHLDLNDQAGFLKTCEQAKELGFDGKTLIHPNQIEIANDVFSPSAEKVETSLRIIDAYEAALAAGDGVTVLDGKLIENLHVENAKRILHLAEQIKK